MINTGSGVQFNGDGPIMSGTWYNPQTGHKFTVRDCFFEDGNFIVMATNGQRYDYNTIQNYIQCNDANGKSIEPDASVMAPKTQQSHQNLPPEVTGILAPEESADPYAELMIPEDAMTVNPLTKGLGNLNDRNIAPASDTTEHIRAIEGSTEDMRMIDRVLHRHPSPEFDAVLNWACPEKQIETLVDVLGIEPALIAEYYVSKLNQDAIFASIKTKLASYINSQWGPNATTTIESPVTPEPEQSAKPKARTAKKVPAKTKK